MCLDREADVHQAGAVRADDEPVSSCGALELGSKAIARVLGRREVDYRAKATRRPRHHQWLGQPDRRRAEWDEFERLAASCGHAASEREA